MSFIGPAVNKVLNVFGRQLVKVKRRKKGVPTFYDEYDMGLGYDLESEANEGIRIVRKNTMMPYVNLLTLYEQAVYCETNNIEGDFVECGVWKGGATGLMAFANLTKGKKRRDIHLFDAFTEICAPDAEVDGDRAVNEIKHAMGNQAKVAGELQPMTGLYDRFGGPGSLDDNKKLLEQDLKYPKDKIHYHVGWFQDTMPEASKQINKIAILRLDGDWYASTKICLDYLYDKVVDGGFIIIDDYGAYDGCKKAVDEFLANRKINVFINYSSESCRYWIKGQQVAKPA